MAHRLVRPHRLEHAEPAPPPRGAVARPELRCDQPGLDLVRPAALAPPTRVVVAAGVDERRVRAVRHRDGVDPEGGQVHDVRGTLVVQGPRLGVRAHRERPRGNEHLGGRRCCGGLRRGWGVQHGRAGAQLVRGEHRLVVLLLVLHDHSEGEALVHQPPAAQRAGAEGVERLLPHLRHVGARLRRAEQRQLDPAGPGVLERVVEPVDLRAQRLTAADVAHQPQLLLAADVREVPHQR